MHFPNTPMPRAKQGGAALIIGLILLLVLTILAFSGMNSATTELAMSGNEQFRNNATDAASAGIETAIAKLAGVPTSTSAPPTVIAATAMPDSTANHYSTRSRFVGEEGNLPQSSAEKFIGFHFEIESDGSSARNSKDKQKQGVMVVASAGGAGETSYRQIGTGLE